MIKKGKQGRGYLIAGSLFTLHQRRRRMNSMLGRVRLVFWPKRCSISNMIFRTYYADKGGFLVESEQTLSEMNGTAKRSNWAISHIDEMKGFRDIQRVNQERAFGVNNRILITRSRWQSPKIRWKMAANLRSSTSSTHKPLPLLSSRRIT